MVQARRDDNFVPGMQGVSSVDGVTPTNVEVNPTTGGTLVEVVGGGTGAAAAYDYIDIQQTSSTVETYVYKIGGSGGTTVRTITVTYTDNTKANLDTVAYA